MTGKITKGYTLVEMLIAVAIFALTATLLSLILLNYLKAQRQILARQSLENNLRQAMEMMVKDVHQGWIDYDYYIEEGYVLAAESGIEVLALRNLDGQQIVYSLSDGILQKNSEDMWSEGLTLAGLNFYVRPIESGQLIQPYVIILLAGEAEDQKGKIYKVDLQTTISSRYYGG